MIPPYYVQGQLAKNMDIAPGYQYEEIKRLTQESTTDEFHHIPNVLYLSDFSEGSQSCDSLDVAIARVSLFDQFVNF